MKNSLLFIFFAVCLLMVNSGYSQQLRDTIVTKQNGNIICKVTKISDYDIEYKKDTSTDAIIYVISKEKVRQIRLGNGTVEEINRDEMEMNAETEILDKRQAIKFHFFAPFNDHLAITYERSLKMGTNIEATFGLINNTMFEYSIFESYDPLTQGAFIKFGPKFNLGNSYYMKGMKYSHPLKGKYFKPEIIITSLGVKNVDFFYYDYDQYYTTSQTFRTNVNVNGVALMLNYGNQYILGNIMTFGFNLGLGYSFVSAKFTNKELEEYISQNTNSTDYYYSDAYAYANKMYSHVRTGQKSGLAFEANVTLGYIFK